MLKRLSLLIALSLALSAEDGQAQASDNVEGASRPIADESYAADFFVRFNPQTALDMVRRIPGFTLDVGTEGVRGFSSGNGNVFVDGQRPSTKTSLTEVLERLPAAAVERIELIRDGAGSADAAGQPVVANIVTSNSASAGSWSAEMERAPDGRVYPRAEISVTQPVGDWQLQTKANAFWERFSFISFRRDLLDAEGNFVRYQEEALPSTLSEMYLFSEGKRAFAGGTLTLNGRLGYSDYGQTTTRIGYPGRGTPGAGAIDRRVIKFDSTYVEAEAGTEWLRTLPADWTLKLVGLGTWREEEQQSRTGLELPPGSPPARSGFDGTRKPLELVGRATMSKGNAASFRPEIGGEMAFNALDSTLTFSSTASAPIPASNVRIEELRAEVFSNFSWPVDSNWTLEGGLAIEGSKISVTGDAENEQTIVILKPSAGLSRKLGTAGNVRFDFRRSAGQLEFEDFAASAEVEEDREFAGNPQLIPDKTWRVSTTADWRTRSGSAVNLTVFHEWKQDVLEQVLLTSGVPGLGNAGEARSWGLEGSLTLPLNPLLPGGQLESSFDISESRFEDPLTSTTRRLDGLQRPQADVSLRQDLPDIGLAWGATYTLPSETEFFFFNEQLTSQVGDEWILFAETTRLVGLTTRLTATYAGNIDFPQERRLFAPNRSGALQARELIDRTRGTFVTLAISGKF